jgi:glyoxylase-like metal-dependent hydrolase (beta-lactamase superfamily II)
MANIKLAVRLSLLLPPVLVLFAGPPQSLAQDVDRTPGLRKLAEGCFVYLHTDDRPGVSSTFNSGIIVTDEGVVVIDALGSEAVARQVRHSISTVTSKPVRFLISSTPHSPFTGGNAVYADTFRIAQEGTREDLIKLLDKKTAEERKNEIPQLTFGDRIALYLGGREIQVLFLGRGHTRSDTIVFLPQERIAYMGETFYCNEFPYISSGYSADWLRTIEAAERLEADIFVPGHGFLPRNLKEARAELRNHWQVLKDVRNAVEDQVRKGASEDQALAAIDLPQFKRFKGYQRALEIAVRRIYAELTVGLP